MSMYKGIEHTAIATPDPEALASWYDRILNFPIVHRYAGNVFVKAPDDTMLEIIPSEGDQAETQMKTPGIRHLAISVDDFEAGKKDLESKGVEIVQEVNASGNRLAFFLDPEGNILHLIHRETPIV
ncbi:MAG: VOC family protein [Bryobacterales bacterium]|nr:VOC family protein [Bryobacterales bacterium]